MFLVGGQWMLKINYSKNTRYLVGKDDKQCYLIDADSDGSSRFVINPSKYVKTIYPLSTEEYNRLYKRKITAKDIGIGGLSLTLLTVPIGSILYKIVQLFHIGGNKEILFISLIMFPLIFFFQKLKDFLSLKIYDVPVNSDKAIKVRVIFLDKKEAKHIFKGNFIMFGFTLLLLYMVYDVGSRTGDSAIIIVAIFAAILLFYRHRLFLINLSNNKNLKIKIEEK